MTDICPSCGTRRPEAGLCAPCRGNLRFVVRPEAHREHYRRTLAAATPIHGKLERLGIITITSLPRDNSLWICDLCNAQIPVAGEHTLIPVMGGYAFCIPCAAELPFWPDGWTQPAPRSCRCGACQRPLLEALTFP